MQGNVVQAARWLGACLVLASMVFVAGLHWTRSAHADRLAEVLRGESRPNRESTTTAVEEKPVGPPKQAGFVDRFSPDPQVRMRGLLNRSEDLREIEAEW